MAVSISWHFSWQPEFDQPGGAIIKQGNVFFARVPSLEWFDFYRDQIPLPCPRSTDNPNDPLFTCISLKYVVIRHDEASCWYLDIEHEVPFESRDPDFFNVEISVIIGRVFEELIRLLPEGVHPNPVAVVSEASRQNSPTTYKYSYHVIFRGVGHFENYESRLRFKRYLENLSHTDRSLWVQDLRCPIDFSVYSKKQVFRLVDQFKHDYEYDAVQKRVIRSEVVPNSRLVATNDRGNWLAHCPTWIGKTDAIQFHGGSIPRDELARERRAQIQPMSPDQRFEDTALLDPPSMSQEHQTVFDSLFGEPMILTRSYSSEPSVENYRLTPAAQTGLLLKIMLDSIPMSRVSGHSQYVTVLYILHHELSSVYTERDIFIRWAQPFLERVRPNFTSTDRMNRWAYVCNALKDPSTPVKVHLGTLAHSEPDDTWNGKEWLSQCMNRVTAIRTHYCPIHQLEEPYCQIGIRDVLEDGVRQRYITCFNSKPPLTSYLGPSDFFCYTVNLTSVKYISKEPSVVRALWSYCSRSGTVERGFFGGVDHSQKHTLVFVSPMGTGKTVLLEKFFTMLPKTNEDGTPVTAIAITNRTALSYAMMKRLDGKIRVFHYKTKHEQKEIDTGGLILVQLDSIVKTLTRYGQLRRARIVILEELTALLQYFSSETLLTGGKLASIIMAFEFIVRNADLVIVNDADTSENSLRVLEKLRGNDIKLYRNVFYPLRRKVKIYLSHLTWQSRLLRFVFEKNRRVFLACNSRQFAEGIYALMMERARVIPKRVKLYTSQSSQADRLAVFDPNEAWKDMDVVITTPVIECGIDHTKAHFHDVFGYFSPNSSSPPQCNQMMGRVRNPINETAHICLSVTDRVRAKQNAVTLPTDYEEVKAYLATHCHLECPSLIQPYIDTDGRWQLGSPGSVATEIACGITRVKHISHNDYIGYFQRCLTKIGATYEFVKNDEGDMNDFKLDLKTMEDYSHSSTLTTAKKVAMAKELEPVRVQQIAHGLNSVEGTISEDDQFAFIKNRILASIGLLDHHEKITDPLFYVRYSSPSQFTSWLYMINYRGDDMAARLAPPEVIAFMCRHFYIEAESLFFSAFKKERCDVVKEILNYIGLYSENFFTGQATFTSKVLKFASEKLSNWLAVDSNMRLLACYFPRSISQSTLRMMNRASNQPAGDLKRFLNDVLEPLVGLYFLPQRNNRFVTNDMVVSSHLAVLQLLDFEWASKIRNKPYTNTYVGLRLKLEHPLPSDTVRAMLLPNTMYTSYRQASR